MDYHQKVELQLKFAASQAAFKKRVEEALRGQRVAEEATAKLLKLVTEAVLGKQPENGQLSEEELKKCKK